MNTQKFFIGLFAIVAVVFGGLYVSLKLKQTVPDASQPFGSIAGNQPTEPFYFQGGSTGAVRSFISTTTVACAIQNPTTATTTFTARWDVPVSTSTATVLVIATSTNSNRFATTTAILSTTLAANKTGSGSYVGANNQNLLGPGEWVQVGYGSGTTLPTTAQQQTGICSVSFINIR